MRPLSGILLALALWLPRAVSAADFQPDPRSVQWYGPAYRYPQAGWIVLHIEGEPYERGIQHGRLLAPEIAAHIRCLATVNNAKTPEESWEDKRVLVNSLFLRGYSREQLEEMKGIADSASAAGARFAGREIDLLDIAAINSPNEFESLIGALQATSIGLADLRLTPDPMKPAPPAVPPPPKRPRPLRCNAFAATGSATKDGKIVFGHITQWVLYPANFYNVWIDLKPSQGHRFVMQSYPGGIHSGMDYSINDAGILMSETTVDQTYFNIKGSPLAARIREATQYADTIDEAVAMLTKNGNGLSTTEWILGDLKTNEIALLTLGTRQSKLYRSSKNEWIGGAEGFYWSCNNTKDREIRLETVPILEGRPSAAAAFEPTQRDAAWLGMYERYRGLIDAEFARRVLTMSPIVSASSVDAKYSTADLAGQFRTWATFGPPFGPSRQPNLTERQKYPEVHPLVCNPWVVLHAVAPAPSPASSIPVADLHDPKGKDLAPPMIDKEEEPEDDEEKRNLVTTPAWRGTLLPKTDADIWLTTAFANYERIVALEKTLRTRAKNERLTPAHLDRIGVALFYYRSIYELAARAGGEVPLAQTHSNLRDTSWFQVASGKGVLLLNSLRSLVGAEKFDLLMEEFGRAHAGKEVTVAQFQSFLEDKTKKHLDSLFETWLHQTGLPRLTLDRAETQPAGEKWTTAVTVGCDPMGTGLAIPVSLELAKGETTRAVHLAHKHGVVSATTDSLPVRVVVDKHGLSSRGNGGPFAILTFKSEADQALIVYGTRDEEANNREAAGELQTVVRLSARNTVVPIKRDDELTDEDLKDHHLVLIGRPDTNILVNRFRNALPVTFGSGSFEVRGECFAHPESAIVMAAENPLNRRYSVVVIAGLGCYSTLRTASLIRESKISNAEVVVLPFNQAERAFVLTPRELIRELPGESLASKP